MKSFLFVIALILGFPVLSSAQIIINEICPANADINYDPDYFNFSAWIELYNNGNSSVNVSGYYLSDDPGNKNKWQIPSGTSIAAKGFLLVWADEENSGRHTNYKLDSDGETVVLSNASLSQIDLITYPKQYANISYGRKTDGEVNWSYMVTPTPAAKNAGPYGTQRIAGPLFSLSPGRYSSSQNVTLSHILSNAGIRYTTDGAEPTINSPLYSAPIPITASTTLKARAFLDGFLPSKTEVNTYFINEHPYTLPVVSLSLSKAYMEDTKIGIYVEGTNGSWGNCMDRAVNWNQDWDRHTYFEYFDNTGKKILGQDIDIRIGGACSRGNPQKSLVVKARDKYGKSIIEHDFFKSKPISEFGGFMLRNSGNDFWYTMFRDALMQTLPVGQMDIDYMAYQPSIVYINGKYWGIQNIREKIDGDYITSNYGIDKDDVDLIETYGNAIEGTADKYNSYLNNLQQMDLTTDDAFAYIDDNIDVQEFINYLTAEIYYCNTDWPGNNVKFWRQRSTNSKFRWILWDMDFGFGIYSDRSYATHETLDFATATDGPSWPNPPSSTLHIRSLLKNPTFRMKFIQTLTASLSTTFKPERVVTTINSFQDRIKTEMPFHVTRWQQSMDNWNYNVQLLRDFALTRNNFMKSHIADFFGLGEAVLINTESFPAGSGGVILNGIKSMEPVVDGFYYKDLPYTVVAAPAAGYQFSYFKVKKNDVTNYNLIGKSSSWKYFDSGSLPDVNWATLNFSDATWTEGAAELGYGDGDESTVVSYGSNAGSKHITTYFRKSFDVSDPVGLEQINASVLFDDGVVVYLNGEEVFRSNIPAGPVSYNTLASGSPSSETAFNSFVIPQGKLLAGTNVIAVEVHQNSGGSSDISFDFQMSTFKNGAESEYTTTESTISDVANSSIRIQAYYEPAAIKEGIVINEINASNNSYQDESGQKDDWIELYNSGIEPIDVSGFFITDNLANKSKHRIVAGQNGETVLAPGEYKIFWADEQVLQGALHLNFKLSADGETVALYQKSGSTLHQVDEVTFGKQPPLTSFSRIPDVTGPFILTSMITPLATNIFEEPTASEISADSEVDVYPNPTDGLLNIKSTASFDAVKVFNSSGQLVKRLPIQNGDTSFSMESYPPGLYLIVFNGQGKSVSKRIIRR